MSQASDTMRREWKINDAKRDAGLTTPDDIQRFDDIQYGPDPVENKQDVYRPKNTQGKIPVIVSVHGGGWVYGDKERYQFYCMDLAERGFAVGNLSYRLAPEYKFPRGLEDCYLACKWAIEHKEKLGIAEDRLFVCGDSSGGNFAAAIALMAKDRKEFDVYGQILIYPVTDVAEAVKKRSLEVYGSVCGTEEHPTPVLTSYFKNIKADAGKPYASPLLADDLEGLPKALFIQAECDGLVDDGLMYAKRLKDAGVPVECKVYEGMPHAFILRTYSETFEALDQICAFLKK